jgi:hypothetical protein
VVAAPPSTRIDVPGGRIDVTIERRSGTPSDGMLLAWVEKAGRAVAAYYGAFPVPRVALTIFAGGPGKISNGLTRGDGGEASIRISVGEGASEEDFVSNWELVHEMVHLAFPSMTGHAWIEEGIATYVEPLARSRSKLIPADDIWRWLLWGLPQGLEGIREQGFDRARSWGATYWGGALFCFLADVQIRQRTGNTKSLDDALRGIVRAGGNVTVSWPLEKALEAGDHATGVPVLAELYAKMRAGPVSVDLPAQFRQLGVSASGGRVAYDDKAPLAAIRKGITMGGSSPSPGGRGKG